jgi:formamidopyrimidine-DNA glycosylase
MPELPEVETVRADMQEVLPNRTIVDFDVFDGKLGNKKDFLGLQNSVIDRVDRRGKYILIERKNADESLIIHLRMTGQIIYRSPKMVFASGHPSALDIPNLPDKHVRMSFKLDDGGKLFFRDSRRFGTVIMLEHKKLDQYFTRFGIEPFTNNWNYADFKKNIKRRKTSLKATLLNQEVIFGLGNIYVDEMCFRAGVLPNEDIERLTEADMKKLYNRCEEVLRESIEMRGTSIKDYLDGSGKSGNFAEKLMVYSRGGLPCYKCGNLIVKTQHAGRGTHFCVRCQKPKR